MRLSACCLLILVVAGCERAQPPAAPPNVVFISIDTLRPDHLGCYGYRRATSPNIDKLARGGTVFDNAVSTCSWTLPAHASMLTGLYPAFHGLQDDGAKLAPHIRTVAEGLKQQGYTTVGVVSHVYVSSEFGLERGFDKFDDSLIAGGAKDPNAEQVVDRAVQVMSAVPPGRFFLFVHFFDPHWDYTPPPPFDTKFPDPSYGGPIDGTLTSMIEYVDGSEAMPEADRQQAMALYDGEIAYVDAQIGRLLGALEARGRMRNALVLVTADHGEEFKEHGLLGHGKTLYGEQLRIPLIIAGHPKFPAGTRRKDLVSLVDLGPTLLALAGADYLSDSPGVSLLDQPRENDDIVFAESIRFGNDLRAARMLDYKLIHQLAGDAQLYYNLRRDPLERMPLPRDPIGEQLWQRLTDYAASVDAGWYLKLISVTGHELRCRARIQTEGHIANARRYFSGNVQAPSGAQVNEFLPGPDGKSLTFDVNISMLMGTVAFETVPPNAPVTFQIEVTSAAPDAGVFLVNGERIGNGQPLTLLPTDERLAKMPADYTKVPPGCYIRAVMPAAVGVKTELSEEALRRLKSLGYIGSEEDDGG